MADAAVARLEAVAARLEAVAARMGAPAAGGDEAKVPLTVTAYDDFHAAAVAPLIATCKGIKGVEGIGADLETAFKRQRDVIFAAAKCKKPSQTDLMKFVDAIVKVVTKYQNPDNRDPLFPFHKSMGEFIQSMNWMFMPGPVAIITATKDAADFYMMKVLKMSKDVQEPETGHYRAFVKGIKQLVDDFAAYVKTHFLTGLIWNPKGEDLKSFNPDAASAGGAAPAAPPLPAGVPPPPPGGPPAAPPVPAGAPASAPAAAPAAGGMAAVFAEIQAKKDRAAAGMKKVTDDMKTKNMKDVPPAEPIKPKAAIAPAKKFGAAAAVQKPPSLTCKQGTWFCENYDGEQVEIKDVKMKENVYIYNCNNCVIQVPDKVKGIQVDKCFKTRIFFNSVVSTFELVNCKRTTVFVQDKCATVIIDKSSGIAVNLNEVSVKDPPIMVTSNVTELNLVVPGKNPDDDPVEMSVAEQFITTFKDGRVETKPVEHKA